MLTAGGGEDKQKWKCSTESKIFCVPLKHNRKQRTRIKEWISRDCYEMKNLM